MRNHKSVGKCNILKDVQDDENIHFCQDTVENINQATDRVQSSQSNVEKASSLCSYKKAVARTRIRKTVVTKWDSYLIKTTKSKKEAINEQIARIIYATSLPFRMVDHPEFIKFIHFLHPGYNPPNRIDIGGKLLDTVHKNSLTSCSGLLHNQSVTMSIDGWSNVHNESVVCTTVTTMNSDIYLADTIDTSGHSHTSDYLVDIAVNSIKRSEKQFGCKVCSVVADNAPNVSKMRQKLKTQNDVDVIRYGCSAHMLNLLAQDLAMRNIKE